MAGWKITRIVIILFFSSLISCAGLRIGTTTSVSHPPYYSGKARLATKRIAHLPIVLDKRLQKSNFDDKRKTVIQPVLDEMNAFFKKLHLSKPLPGINLPVDDAPDVFVGSEASDYSPVTYAGDDEKSRPEMIVYKYKPSQKWKEALFQRAEAGNVDYFLYITLGFSDYPIRQKDLLGRKELELGTGYSISVKWLSSLDTPAEVLQVCGALLDKNGKILRAGAEGILAKKTGFWLSALDVQEMLSPGDIQKFLKSERRNDLPHKPLIWQVALLNLVTQLIQRPDLLVK
ncbi:MAG: hypothetical protein GWP06_00810 [Actinobacteria bacterium]|nr:hypothetical protein [Actinomycetota bacterium]